MDDFLFTAAKIFFVVSSSAVVVACGGFVVLLLYLLPLVRDARDMMAKFSAAAAEAEKEYERLRDSVEEEGAKGKAIIDMLLGFVGRALSVPPPRRKKISRSASKR